MRPRSSNTAIGRSEGGFSLLELVVAGGLLALALLMASQILLESQRLMTRTNRSLVGDSDAFASALIEADLRAGSYVTLSSPEVLAGEWVQEPLEILKRSGERIVYEQSDGSLVRRSIDATGAETGARTVQRTSERWTWRALNRRLFEVRIERRVPSVPRGAALLQDRERRVERTEEVIVRAYLRDRGGRRRW